MPYLEQHVSVDATCICKLRESLMTLIGMPWKPRNWMGACADASGATVGWEAQLKESCRHLHMVYFHQTIFVNKHPSRRWQLLLMLEGRHWNINGDWIMKSADAVCALEGDLLTLGSLFIISDEHLIIIGTQIWFQITIFRTDCLHFHFATNEMWFFYLDSVVNTWLITILFLS